MSKLFDWLNDNPWLIVIGIILVLCLRCSSTDRADTIRLQERSETALEQLDKAEKDCLTSDCKQAIKQAKELIKDSRTALSDKDSEIAEVKEEIQENEIYTDIGKFIVWGFIAVILCLALWIFRKQIFDLIKLARPV